MRSGVGPARGAGQARPSKLRYAGALGVLALAALALTGCDALSSRGYAAPDPAAASAVHVVNSVADFNQAEALRNAGRCDRAIPLYLRAINANPMYVNAYRELGACYASAQIGSFNAAILEYDKALQIDPTNFGIYIDRAGVEVGNGNTGAAQSDDLTALRLAPPQVPSYLSIAQSFGSFQDLADEAMAIGKAIAIAPGNLSLYEQQASVYLQMSDPTRAYADYDRALHLALSATTRAGLYADLADVYSGQQDYSSAFGASDAAIKLQPTNASLYVRAANIRLSAGDLGGALALFNRALRYAQVQSDAEAAHEGKGDTLLKLGQNARALAEYSAAARLATDPSTQATLSAKLADLADTYSGMQNYTAAFRASALALGLQPTNASLYVRSGAIHLAAGAYGAALTLYDEALREASAPSDLEAAHEGKGDTYLKLGQVRKAIAEYNAAVRLTTDVDTLTRLNGKIKAASSGRSK